MLEKYVELILQLVEGEISTDEFDERYVKLWYAALDDFLAQRSPEVKIISDIFLEVDALTNDPPYDTTAEALREAARQALADLLELQKEHNP